MAPFPQIFSRDTTVDGSSGGLGSNPNPVTPEVIAGILFSAATLLGLCVWLGVRYYRKRTGAPDDLIVKGVMSEGDEMVIPRINVKGPPGQFSRDQLTASIILPNQQIIRPDATKDDIMRYHIASGTMTRPFSVASLALPSPKFPPSRPISIVSFQNPAGGNVSPRRASFFSFGNHRSSVASSASNVSSMFGVEGRKIRQLFTPVLPDELVLSLGEKVTLVKAFDDGWCIVGRDSFIKPGEVEMGAVPAWCFVKPVKGLKASRPMRTSSLGVTVELDGPGFSSREEVISWSNF